jgi:hypothetical protein
MGFILILSFHFHYEISPAKFGYIDMSYALSLPAIVATTCHANIIFRDSVALTILYLVKRTNCDAYYLIFSSHQLFPLV